MASKFGFAGGIPERRVRPIWDAIDSLQYKNALKHSTALLSKHPNSPYALALKALILERMGKPEEALSICLSAKELLNATNFSLVDDLTLSTLQIVFQRLDRLDLATSCYEFACGKFPTNLELMMGLFNCYVREYSYVKQQQTAIKMYKLANEERYLLWAVCSIQLQVLCGQGEEKLLALAEGLLKKHISSHGLQEPEAVFVYISILEKQGKFGDALEMLFGKLGSLLTIGVDRLRLEGRLLAQSGDYTAAISTFQKILHSSPDDWECFLQYLSCVLDDDKSWCFEPAGKQIVFPALTDNLLSIPDDVFDSRITYALAFVKKLQVAGRGETVRGPFLANIEIERRKRLHQKGDSEKFLNVIVQYFCRFGHLSCFCSDVEAYLELLNHEEKNNLVEKLKQNSKSQPLESVKSLGRLMNLHKMLDMIGMNYGLTMTELEGVAMELVDMYCKSLPLSRDLDVQESMHGEELLTMASNILVQLFWRSQKHGYILEAVMVLELGLTVRRYKTLDIKNILFETLLHQILPQMLLSPLWVDLSDILNDYLKFMDDHLRESADLTFLAYRHRNYSKVRSRGF
ncbi:N-terminal acetyltransferase B complex auxiliary subunit NAA25-like protein [Drosera capensis]